MKRRRYATRAELVHRISCNDEVHDRGIRTEEIDVILDALAGYGVDLDALVKIEVDEG